MVFEKPGELLAFSRLAAVQMGLTLQEVLERLGPPARHSAGPTHILEYHLQDGSRAEILYVHPNLIKIVHYQRNGSRVSWVPAGAKP